MMDIKQRERYYIDLVKEYIYHYKSEVKAHELPKELKMLLGAVITLDLGKRSALFDLDDYISDLISIALDELVKDERL